MKPTMFRTAWHMTRVFSLRHARRDWRHTATIIAILALGVAAFMSIRLANRAAIVSFSGFSESVSGGSDLTLTAPIGNLTLEDLRGMREALGNVPVHLLPLLRASATLPDQNQRTDRPSSGREFVLLGADWIALQNLSGLSAGAEGLIDFDNLPGESLWETLRNPRHLIITTPTARRYGLSIGDNFSLIVQDRTVAFEIVAILPLQSGGNPVPENLLLMDMAALQRLTHNEGQISQVDIVLPNSIDKAARLDIIQQKLTESANGRWQVRDPIVEQGAGERMTAAFRLNLTVLSLISLLVGAYLVTQALDAAVVRRRHEIAVLRSLGVTRGELRLSWAVEIGVLGLLGSALGVLLGWLLAQVTVVGVSQTVNALYQSSSATAAQLTSTDIAWGMLIGLCFSALAGWLPLKDAAATPPAQILGVGNWSPGLRLLRNVRLGLALLLLGAVTAQLPPLTLEGGGRFPLAGYASAFLWLTGGTLVVGWLFKPLGWLGGKCLAASAPAAIGISRLRRAGSRHRLAAAGLFVASAMATAMTLLVGSFEQTIVRWMDVRFQADVYISSSGSQSADSRNHIRPETWQAIGDDPRVAAMDPYLRVPIELNGKSTFLAGADLSLLKIFNRLWLVAPPSELDFAQPLPSGELPAIANEAFMERFGLRSNAQVELPLSGQTQHLRIVAIEADYGNEQGQLVVQRELLQQWTSMQGLTNLTILLRENEQTAAFINEWQKQQPALSIRSNHELRTTALAIFRQTFAVTHALELLALFIAMAGLGLALNNILQESRGQLQTMRQLGMRRNEIATVTTVEGLGIALVGLAGGVLLGFALGYLLVFVINKQSFGWTLQWSIPWSRLLLLALLVCGIATLTAWLVTRRYLKLAASKLGAILLAFMPLFGMANPVFTDEGFRVPQADSELTFPRAHGSHPDYKIEWWYFTGQVSTAEGRRFGYQATFFRNAAPLDGFKDVEGFGDRQLYMAHMALTDIDGSEFHYEERLNRDGWDAFASTERMYVRNGNWTLEMTCEETETMALQFTVQGEVAVQLTLKPEKPRIRFGETDNGVSRKGEHPHANSYYISFTRLQTQGEITVRGETFSVNGSSWMDHEIASRQLSEELEGWDWTAIHLHDGREIKAYILRRLDGSPDPYSRLFWIEADGSYRRFGPDTFRWQALRTWTSPATGISYPIEVMLHLPDELGEDTPSRLHLRPLLDAQELTGTIGGIAYWEGACEVVDADTGKVIGSAYMELAGYGGGLGAIGGAGD